MKTCGILFLLAPAYLASAGEISDYYFKRLKENTNWAERFVAASDKSRTHDQVTSTNHGISELGIERSGCYGTCPVYTFIVRSDGSFRYKGDKYVDRTGEYSGTIPLWQFHELAKFIVDSGYMRFEDQYRRGVTDNSTVFTTVVLNGKRKVISNYANSGPTTLWAIEELIDALMTKASWKPELPSAPGPVLPKVTRYDYDPVLRTAYLESFRKGYVDAWERRENLPVFAPTGDADKARVFGYTEGMVDGRAALAKWFGTNSPQSGVSNSVPLKR